MSGRLCLALASVLVAAGLAAAGPLAAGDVLPPLAGTDQHDAPLAVGAGTRTLLVSGDMDGGGLVKALLADRDQAWLDARGIVYLADVSRMPGMVTRLFALPAMRKRAYRVLVDRDGSLAAALPSREGTATVIGVADGVVIRVTHAGTVDALAGAVAER